MTKYSDIVTDIIRQLREMAILLQDKVKSAEYTILPEHCRSVLTANAELFEMAAYQLEKISDAKDLFQSIKIEAYQATKTVKVVNEWDHDDSNAMYRYRYIKDHACLLQIRDFDKKGNPLWRYAIKAKEFRRAMLALLDEITLGHINLCAGTLPKEKNNE